MTKKRFILIPQYFGSLVFDRVTTQYAGFDAGATELFSMSISRSAREFLASEISGDRKTAALRFIKAYEKMGYFSSDGCFNGAVLAGEPAGKKLRGPLTVHLEVTGDCNLSCKHCFAAGNRSGKILDLKELDSLFREMAMMGSFRLGLTGGEPFMRKEIFEIIDLAVERGLTPCLTTNGLLLSSEVVERLKQVKFAWLNISLDGASAETNDYTRGSGVFHRVIKNIKKISRQLEFSMAFTVMKHNTGEMGDFCKLSKKMGAKAVVFRPLYPVGSAVNNPDLMPGFHEYISALNALDAVKKELGIDIQNIHPWGPGSRGESQGMVYENFGCGAANTVCSISANGTVSPCSFLGREYRGGSLRKRSFREIWNESEPFQRLRNITINEYCGDCRHYGVCSGGCRVRALVMNNSIDAPDPWCMNTEKAYG
ncbi:MAG: radical SAM protein [bacterium]|nr:radical SAM protein [bacterium]